MRNKYRNSYTGYLSAGFRFCFHVTSIAHRPLFLPLDMKMHPLIQRLLKGESPLSVFKASSITAARKAFCELRKQYDFPYWAIKDYSVKDMKDADRRITLNLNNYQHYIVDVLQKRYYNGQLGRYIITKSFGRVGVTTCIQAYMLWLQIFHCNKHSFTCCSSNLSIYPIKANLCRFLHRDMVPPDSHIYIPQADSRSFFNTYRNPDYIRGIDLGFVHFADMSRWYDPSGDDASRVYAAATSAVWMQYNTLIVLEGNIPKENLFQMEKHRNFSIPWDIRLMRLAHLSNNPNFLDHVVLANYPCHNEPHLLHINLDYTYSRSKKIKITPRVLPKPVIDA